MVLGSGIALGVYVPALSLKKQLERLGDHADFMCLEELYRGKDGVMEETKRSFHNDFRLAKISYRLPVRNQTAVDPEAERAFLNASAAKRYDAVITFSGFFSEILKKLMAECPYYRGRIHAVHMDAGTSLSWKKAGALDIDEIWLYRLEDTKILRCLEKPEVCPEKQNRILVHGGGWGIGEYRDIIRDLNAQGFPLDIVVYYPEEAEAVDAMNECYLLDPSWKAGSGTETYPDLLHFEEGRWVKFADSSQNNPLRILMERDIAVVSKPGGGTLSDSLCTATPLIFSEELAYYEKENRILWEKCGFGIGFEAFRSASFSGSELLKMRKRLRETAAGLPLVADCFRPGTWIGGKPDA